MLPERSKPKARYTGSRSALRVSVAHVSPAPAPALPASKPPMPRPVTPTRGPEPHVPRAPVVAVWRAPVEVVVVGPSLTGSSLRVLEPQAVATTQNQGTTEARAERMAEQWVRRLRKRSAVACNARATACDLESFQKLLPGTRAPDPWRG